MIYIQNLLKLYNSFESYYYKQTNISRDTIIAYDNIRIQNQGECISYNNSITRLCHDTMRYDILHLYKFSEPFIVI